MIVRVYSKPQCPQCSLTKALMGAEGIEFVEEDILEPDNLAAAKALGHMSAPVVVAGEESWAGFKPDRIKALAERMKGK